MIITDEAVKAGAMALSEHVTGDEWCEMDESEANGWLVETRAALQAAGPLLIAAELRAQAGEEDEAADYAMNERPEPEDEGYFLGAAAVLRDSAERLRARAADVLDGGA